MGRSHYPQNRHLLDVQIVTGNTHGCLSSSSQQQQQRPHPPAVIEPLRLTPRDETTRVQLQRQRLKEQHATAIVSKTIPGYKTSAGM